MNLLEYEKEIKDIEIKGWILSELNKDKAKWVKSNRTIELYTQDKKFFVDYYTKKENTRKSFESNDINSILNIISKRLK